MLDRRPHPRAGEAAELLRWGAFAVVGLVVCGGLAGQRVRGLLAASVGVAAPAVLIAAALGAPLGVMLAKTNARGRGPSLGVLVGLLILPLHVVAAGWLAALGADGWFATFAPPGSGGAVLLDGWRGAVLVHGIAAAPWVAALTALALRAVDRRREEQALLDAAAARVLLGVSLRDAAAAIAAAIVWSAAAMTTEIAVTDLFRVRTFAEEVYTQAALGALDGGAATDRGAVGLAAGVGAIACVAFASLGVLASRFRNSAGGDNAPWVVRLARPRFSGALALGAPLLLLAGVPIGSLVYQAGERVTRDDDGWRREWSPAKAFGAVASAPWRHRREIGVSAQLGAAVATASVLLGGVVAWRWGRSTRPPRWSLLGVAVALAIPGPLVGLATIRLLNQPPDAALAWLGDLYGTWFAPWLAQTARLAPVAALLLWPAAASVPRSVLDAARADGAGPIARLLRVALPMRWPAVAAVWAAVFALSVGELSATALVAPPGTPPLSVRLLSLLHYGVEDRVAALCLVLVAGYAAIAWAAVAAYRRALRP